MPTKERAARERARKEQATAREVQQKLQASLPSPLQLMDLLRKAGVEVHVLTGADIERAAGQGKTVPTPATGLMRELPAELDMLHMALGELDQAVDRLEVQLQPISRPEPVSERAMTDGSGIPPMSDIAHQIRAARYRVERLLSVVTSRSERLGV